MTKEKDTEIYYLCLHEIDEEDYDYQTHQLYIEGKEAYNLMIKFLNEACPNTCIEASHRVYIENPKDVKEYRAMNLKAVEKDIACQIEDNDERIEYLKKQRKFKFWKQFL